MTTLRKSLKNKILNCFYSAHVRKITSTRPVFNSIAPNAEDLCKTSPKIVQIADSIAQLNLIEVAELTDLLKKKLNLPDAPVMAFGAAAAAAPAAKVEEEVTTQTNFTVKLLKFDEKQKVALIKEIKSLIEGMNLVQAKKFVESAPIVVRENIGKTEAEDLKNALLKVGAEVEIV
ncbi:mitochondrial 39S ribosomal protein L12, putative [Pediculus humanus corporis]|uniref:Mitochondrial 39S ribosomal protein L12, putative n=1 Tax=Pediculus humanus subsp. corporis TaxID=121224 RepID=E0VN08_PEDHC|nr:mitochondrial 39S ribosomal protein L12, putative [Pediculus humanus corporis]EEB14764.1 mitochondrial 39S ribosomal protein L12, putative [Pediculus humanus corporis]